MTFIQGIPWLMAFIVVYLMSYWTGSTCGKCVCGGRKEPHKSMRRDSFFYHHHAEDRGAVLG